MSHPRAVIVVLSGWDKPWLRQVAVLMAFCTTESLRVVAVLRDDPELGVPLIAAGLADLIVMPFVEHEGSTDVAEAAAERHGGEVRYIHERRRPKQAEKAVNPIIARMLARGFGVAEIASLLDVDRSVVLEEKVRTRPSVPRPREARPGVVG